MASIHLRRIEGKRVIVKRGSGRQKKTVGLKCQRGDKKEEIEVGLPGGAVTGSFNLTLLLTFSFFLNYLWFFHHYPSFFFLFSFFLGPFFLSLLN